MPTVSVIIPCYNHGRYLGDALRSVLAQTFQDWEAIVVDDGSTDDTAAVAARFDDPRIRYVFQENRGLAGARNTGIGAASGEHIALLDADDVWEPSFLEESVGALVRNPDAAASYCGFRYMDGDGNSMPVTVCRVVPPEAFQDELLQGSWLSACSVVVRTQAYREAGPFDESLRACEDFDMWLRMSAIHRFVGIPQVLLRYRRLGDNMSDEVDRMSAALAAVYAKHLGSLDNSVGKRDPQKKRAVSNLYTMQVFGYLSQGRVSESAESFLRLMELRPEFAQSLEMWYSLACAHQMVGRRGDFATWQPERAARDVLALLDALNDKGVSSSRLRTMGGRAHLALAWLNYGKGNVSLARQMLRRSIMTKSGLPGLWLGLPLWSRLLPGATIVRDFVRSDAKRRDQQKTSLTL